MKRITMIFALLAATSGLLFSQSMPVKKTMKLKSDEVPSLVRTAFEKGFGAIPENGSWSVYYSTMQSEGKSSANPLWYRYSNKSVSGKIEVTILPNGKVKFAKGIDRKDELGKKEQLPALDKTTDGK
jgi:hypothetical protein